MAKHVTSSTNTATNAISAGAIAKRLTRYAQQAEGALSPNTLRAIRADTAVFTTWCVGQDMTALPASPDTVAGFIDTMAVHKKPATIRRYVASIGHLHRAAEVADPTKANVVKLAIKRLGRQHGSRQQQAAPIGEMVVERILATTPGKTLTEMRDIALLMTARDMLGRRSEVVALHVHDVAFSDDGSATVLVRRSKTDTTGQGAVLWLSPRTTKALKLWLKTAAITEGPLLRSVLKGSKIGGPLDAGTVARIYKKLASRAGVDASAISGHSARVGMAQDLVAHGAELPEVMQAGRWKSPTMPARYAERLTAGRGAVAQYYGRRG